jgi:hypothetical protein
LNRRGPLRLAVGNLSAIGSDTSVGGRVDPREIERLDRHQRRSIGRGHVRDPGRQAGW